MSSESILPASEVPALRVVAANLANVRGDSEFVLYWMIAQRRTTWNYGLQRAVEWARHLNKPLVVLEALRCGYPWASDRLHHFIVEGMADNAKRLRNSPIHYFPYLENQRGAGHGLLAALAEQAAIVVTDDFPCFFLPRMVSSASESLAVRLESVDSNGLLPMRAAPKIYSRAHDFRRFLHKSLQPHLEDAPWSDPLRRARALPALEKLPAAITRRWAPADPAALSSDTAYLADLPIDHSVAPVTQRGGSGAAGRMLTAFLERLGEYDDARNEPARQVTSGLSPLLHFGHISAHEMFDAVIRRDQWNPSLITGQSVGSVHGWWGASPAAETFLDQLITWRELGYNMTSQRDDYDQYTSLPDWAQRTLADHAADPRPHCYSLQEFEAATTHNELWNAAQRQLVREGRIHNYLRMLWGKKILHWTSSPEEALEIMIELNNKYALDGRNPNSYSGIFWILGRYDRAWGPEREIFGKIRYMTADNTARKVKVGPYLEKYAAD